MFVSPVLYGSDDFPATKAERMNWPNEDTNVPSEFLIEAFDASRSRETAHLLRVSHNLIVLSTETVASRYGSLGSHASWSTPCVCCLYSEIVVSCHELKQRPIPAIELQESLFAHFLIPCRAFFARTILNARHEIPLLRKSAIHLCHVPYSYRSIVGGRSEP
jgi:hypothetical protein